MKSTARQDYIITMLIIATLGIITVMISTRWGVGLSPDSVVYVSAARNLLRGQGLTTFSNIGEAIPMTHYPPLFPMLLAGCSLIGLDPIVGARWFNACLLAANTLLVGFMVLTLTRSFWASAFASFLTYSSIVTLSTHSMAWSEPIFLLFGFGGLSILAAYIKHSKEWLIVVAAGAVALSFLARYTGAAFVGTGLLGILLLSKETWNKRILDTTCFCTIGCMPIALWLGRNLYVAGTATNRSVAFHPITIAHLRGGINSLAGWFFHILNPAVPRIIRGAVGGLIALVLLAAFLSVNSKRMASGKSEGGDTWGQRNLSTLPKLLAIFVAVYMGLLVISISCFDAHTPLSNRILSPVYIAFVIILLRAVNILWKDRIKKRPKLRITFITLCAMFCIFSLTCTGLWTMEKYRRGSGYASPDWYNSEIINQIERLDSTVPIVTNAPDAIHILLGRPAHMIPRKVNPGDNTDNNEYLSEMNSLKEQLESEEGIIVYFHTVRRWYLPSHHELKQQLPLHLVKNTDEGSIFRVEN